MSDLFRKIGADVLLSPQEFLWIARSAPHRYKVFQIEKRAKGQFRTIAQPAREVKELQYSVMKHFLSRLPVHPAATGYRKNLSIADNARHHVNGRFLLKMDFKDFFPSIKALDFQNYLRRTHKDMNRQEIDLIARILFWKPRTVKDFCLSIGAPSSPMLSNILLWEFDSQLAARCAELGVAYSRYADDLSFSANESVQLRSIEKTVHRICKELSSPRLVVNRKKTIRLSNRVSRRVTGLVISNDAKVSLGRGNKRLIRAAVHRYLNGGLNEAEISKLCGTLAFVNSVEPTYLSKLRKKYGGEVIRTLQSMVAAGAR